MTGIRGGGRVAKDDMRIEANGEIDELNCLIGVVRAMMDEADVRRSRLESVQRALMVVMGHVAASGGDDNEQIDKLPSLVSDMEKYIDKVMSGGKFDFVLPGSCRLSAFIHLARSKARTAERRLWTVNKSFPLNPNVMAFFNRLSDYLFAMACDLTHIEHNLIMEY